MTTKEQYAVLAALASIEDARHAVPDPRAGECNAIVAALPRRS